MFHTPRSENKIKLGLFQNKKKQAILICRTIKILIYNKDYELKV